MKTLHELVADKLEQADPSARAALLRIPLDKIDRWLANGPDGKSHIVNRESPMLLDFPTLYAATELAACRPGNSVLN